MSSQNKRNRRRLGARPYKNYSEDMLKLAVDLVKSKKCTSYYAEKHFSIPRRTIEKRVKNLHSNKPGPRYRLTLGEETKFIKVLIAAGDFGCPMSLIDFKLIVWDYLKKNNKTYIFNDKIPGDWWVKSFLYRHKDKLTVRSTQNITKARAEKTLEEFKEYFRNLEISLQNLPPTHIMNYDETNVSDDPGSAKSIFRRGIKYPERIINHSKGCISLMFAATAAGELLPPYVVYKAEHLWSEWCKDGPEGACYNRSKSGWFDSVLFLDWFKNIVIPWASQLEGEKLVIGDNLSSHLNTDVVELCETHQIRFAFLPSRSTQLTQPLDVAFFAPLKKSWRTILLKYKTENPKQVSLNKSHFPLLLKNLIEIANLKKQNIISGFKATGIYPFNPYEVYKKIPEYEDEIKYDVDDTLLSYLKENKHPNPITARQRNTKLNVPSGKSVKSSDIALFCTKKRVTTKKSTKNEKSIVKLTCEDCEHRNEQTIESKGEKNVQTFNYKLIKKSYKRKPLGQQTYFDHNPDSDTDCTVPLCDSSDYDPNDDEDSITNIKKDDKETLDSAHSENNPEDLVFLHIENDIKKIKRDFKAETVTRNQGMKDNNIEQTMYSLENDKKLKYQANVPRNMEIIDDTALEEISEKRRHKLIMGDIKRKVLESPNIKTIQKMGKFKGKGRGKGGIVTILSEIRNTPENRAYFDLNKYGPFALKPINKDLGAIYLNQPIKPPRDKDPVMMETSDSNGKNPDIITTSENTEPVAGCSKPEEINSISYNVNDHILARYILKKRVQYFVGKIIAKDVENKYKISFYKQHGKNDNIRFFQPKIKDIDIIDEKMIVKQVQLMALNQEETELVFFEDDDLIYFN